MIKVVTIPNSWQCAVVCVPQMDSLRHLGETMLHREMVKIWGNRRKREVEMYTVGIVV